MEKNILQTIESINKVKTTCVIVYRPSPSKVVELKSIIRDLFYKEDLLYILIESGLEIPVEHIVSVREF